MAAHPENRIKELRSAQGLSAQQLAERMGTTAATVSRIEGGARRLDLEWMQRFALALGVRVGDLISGDNAIQFARMVADLRVAVAKVSVFESDGKLVSSFESEGKLLPLPARLDTDKPVEAFQTGQRSFIFAVRAYPDRADRDRRFILRIDDPDWARIELRTFEFEGSRGGFYLREAPPSERWLPVEDKRILVIWRALAEFREE